jgi:hypothetical protein
LKNDEIPKRPRHPLYGAESVRPKKRERTGGR